MKKGDSFWTPVHTLPFAWIFKTTVFVYSSGLSEQAKEHLINASWIASLPLSTTTYLTFKHIQ